MHTHTWCFSAYWSTRVAVIHILLGNFTYAPLKPKIELLDSYAVDVSSQLSPHLLLAWFTIMNFYKIFKKMAMIEEEEKTLINGIGNLYLKKLQRQAKRRESGPSQCFQSISNSIHQIKQYMSAFNVKQCGRDQLGIGLALSCGDQYFLKGGGKKNHKEQKTISCTCRKRERARAN